MTTFSNTDETVFMDDNLYAVKGENLLVECKERVTPSLYKSKKRIVVGKHDVYFKIKSIKDFKQAIENYKHNKGE